MILTITIDDTYQVEYDRLLAERGADIVTNTMTEWLDKRKGQRLREDIESIREGTADIATKARVKSALKI